MAHKAQVDYCLSVKNKFPNFFKNTKEVEFTDDIANAIVDYESGNCSDILT